MGDGYVDVWANIIEAVAFLEIEVEGAVGAVWLMSRASTVASTMDLPEPRRSDGMAWNGPAVRS